MPTDIDPVKLCCMHRQSEHNGAMCPTGTTMCCICFESFPPEGLYVDENGSLWDICRECKAHEDEMVKLCEWIKAVQDVCEHTWDITGDDEVFPIQEYCLECKLVRKAPWES